MTITNGLTLGLKLGIVGVAGDAGGGGGGGGENIGADPLLGDIISNPIMEISPALAASYSGTGTTCSNVVQATGTAYDFDMKTSTFVGTAGTSSAYFIPSSTTNAPVIKNGNTNFIIDMVNHSAGDWCYIFAGRTPTASSGHMIPFSTGALGANSIYNNSVDLYLLSSNRAYSIFNNGAGNRQNLANFGGASSGEDKIFGVSYNSSTNQITFFIGENTTGVTVPMAIPNNSGSPETTLIRDLTISRVEGAFGSFSTNGRFYTKALHASQMSSAQFIEAKAMLETRHDTTFN